MISDSVDLWVPHKWNDHAWFPRYWQSSWPSSDDANLLIAGP